MRGAAIDLDAARRGGFGAFFVLSLLLHVGLGVLLSWVPPFELSSPPGVISVALVAPASSPAAPTARAVPVAPPPVPKPPVVEKRVLPEEPSLPEPPPPKPKPRPVREKPPEPAPEPEERDYSDVLAELRAERGEEAPQPVQQPAQQARAAPGFGGSGRPVPPEVAEWMRRARSHVRRTWVVPPGFRSQSLETVVEVELDAAGALRGEPRIVRRSGNPWYDEGVVRSIEKASPLPAPPQAGSWTFVLVSDESY